MEWILLAVFAGLCNGTFALPMKFATKWNWENIWGTFILWGFVVFPIILGFATVPQLLDIFEEVGLANLGNIFLFGFLWGIGSICFGLGIRYMGIGLAFSINIGITIAIGSLMPLFQGGLTSMVASRSVWAVVLGVITILVGVGVNGYAAYRREKELTHHAAAETDPRPAAKNRFFIGIALCVIAGIMSPMLQFAFIYGSKIIQVAADFGVSETLASNAVWMVALFGGFAVNVLYVGRLFRKNKSFKMFKIAESSKYHLLAVVMGLLWIVTIACYGMAVANMGALGLSIGWAIFNSVGIITANLFGLLTKEWQHTQRGTTSTVLIGLVILVLGTCLVAMAEFF